MSHLGDPRVLMELGASVAGKSSLVRAGIVPRLRRDAERAFTPAVIVGTMRSDFLDRLQSSRPLLELRYEVLSLGPMSESDIVEVVEGPAREAEVELDPSLVSALVSEGGTPNALPLLAFTLCELWVCYAYDRRLTRDGRRDVTVRVRSRRGAPWLHVFVEAGKVIGAASAGIDDSAAARLGPEAMYARSWVAGTTLVRRSYAF